MKNFLVLARKYRPKRFAEIRGQSHVRTTLQGAIRKGNIANAYLFCGEKGSGKTTTARLLGKAINCAQSVETGEPCNICKNCTQTPSLNLHELDAASHNSAEDMRHITEQIRYHPAQGGKNVIIIDEVHMLSNAAFNVLLKPLEDTPAHVVFILVTTEKYKVLPTIQSRCQIFDFHPIEAADIYEQLRYIAKEENIVYEEEALALIAEKKAGSLRDALSIFGLVVTFSDNDTISYQSVLRHLNLLDEEAYIQMMDSLYIGNIQSALLQYDQIVRLGLDGMLFVSGMASHLRNLLVAQNSETMPLLQVSNKAKAAYKLQAKSTATTFIYEALTVLQQTNLHYKHSLNPRLHVEIMLIKLGRLSSQIKEQQVSSGMPAPLSTQTNMKAQTKSIPKVKSDRTSYQPYAATDSLQQKYGAMAAEPLPLPLQKNADRITQTMRIPNTEEIKQSIHIPQALPQKQSATSLPPVTLQEVDSLWHTYAEKLKKQGHHIAYNAFQGSIALQDTQIVFSPTHTLAKQNIMEHHDAFMTFLRTKLTHPTLTLLVEEPKPQKEKIVYTDKEKLEDLMKKNAGIAYLANQLTLSTN